VDVGERQRRLRHTAAKDPAQQCGDLDSRLGHEVGLRVAGHHVQQQTGSETAGRDGKTMAHCRGNFAGDIAERTTTRKAETFAPCPGRRVYLPTPPRDTKRPRGIPSLFDRIGQEALRMILEPLGEADVSVHSYGFRPNRSTYDALSDIGHRLKGKGSSYQWGIEGDRNSSLDPIPHRRRIKAGKKRVADRKIRDVLWTFLRAGVMHRGQFEETLTGTPQGGSGARRSA
jgi:RNA-directed DNA polymerase